MTSPTARPPASPPLRIGIVGAGYIAGVVADAIADAGSSASADTVTLVAMASRRRETAATFAATHADRHGTIRVFDDVDALLAWDGVDAVYVATPTVPREAICLAAAAHGKHVLADKPFLDAASVRTITAACRAHGVAFLDATHFPHHARTAQLRRELGARVGTLKAISASFFFPSMDRGNIRHDLTKEPTGAIGDMAWYIARAVVEFAGDGLPPVHAGGYAERDGADGAIVRGAGMLLLANGCTVTWDAGYSVGNCLMGLQLMGDRGTVVLDDFVLDWAGAFPLRTPGYPVGFVHKVGVVAPAGHEHVPTPSEPRALVRLLQHFQALAVDPTGVAAEQARQRAIDTQTLLDAMWQALHPFAG